MDPELTPDVLSRVDDTLRSLLRNGDIAIHTEPTLVDAVIRRADRLATVVADHMRAAQATELHTHTLVPGTTWMIQLPVTGLRLKTRRAILQFRLEDQGIDASDALQRLANQQDADLVVVMDLLNIDKAPLYPTSQLLWLKPAMVQDLFSIDRDKVVSWLGRLITTECDVTPFLPYRTRGAVDEDLFFGRDDELRRLMSDHLRGGILIGPPQSGKTSLLRHLEAKVKPRDQVVCAYLTLGSGDLPAFFERTLGAISLDYKPNMTPDEWAACLRAYARSNQCKPVFLLDEVDRLLLNDAASGLQLGRQMRSLQYEGHVSFYLAGLSALREAVKLEEGPLRNFAEEITLTGLTWKASKRLIQEPMQRIGFLLRDEQARRIFEGTAGVPMLIQEFCTRLLCGNPYLHTESAVPGAALDAVEHSAEYLGAVWDYHTYRLDSLRTAIMMLVTLHPGLQRRDLMQILRTHGFTPGRTRVEAALDFLLAFGVVAEQRLGQYQLISPYLQAATLVRDPEGLLAEAAELGRGERGDA